MLWLGCAAIQAQPAIEQAPLLPPALPVVLAEVPEDAFAEAGAAATMENPRPLTVGPLTLRPRAGFEYEHDTGIPVRPGTVIATSVFSYRAGVTATLGDEWTADYSGNRLIYSNSALRNAYDQAISVAGAAQARQLKLRWGYAYQSTSQPLIDTASQTNVRSHQGLIGISDEPGLGYRIDGSFIPTARFADGIPTSRDWPVALWIYHPLVRDVEIGVGMTAGYVAISPGADQSYYRPQLQLSWRPDARLRAQISAGSDQRRFYSPVREHSARWIYDGRFEYRIFQATILSAYRGRDLTVSLFSSQLSEATTQGVSLQQRLFGHVNLTGAFERQSVHFLGGSLQPVPGPTRDDTRNAGSVRAAIPFRQRVIISLSYQRSRNASTFDGYGFSSEQFAAGLEYRY